MKIKMTSGTELGLPVVAAIAATLEWVNGADSGVFRAVDTALGPLDWPVLSRYKAPEADRLRVRGWLATVAKAVERGRAKRKAGKGGGMVPRELPAVRADVWSELQALTSSFSMQPTLTAKGVSYELMPVGFVKSAPIIWASLATAELMTHPDRFHFLLCPGCDRFHYDYREGKGNRRGRYCSITCKNREVQRAKRRKDKADVITVKSKVKVKP